MKQPAPKYLRTTTLKRRTGRPTAISLFSGAGGADCGMAQAGWEIRVMLEWEKNCCWTLRANYTKQGHRESCDARIRQLEKQSPSKSFNKKEIQKTIEAVKRWKYRKKFASWYHEPEPVILQADITQTTTAEILKAARLKVGEADCVFGGPPCQGFSLANNKRSIDDPRNKLVASFIRVVREAKPKTFWMENVPGMITMSAGKTIREITHDMADAGYKISWNVLDAADYGVPQHRNRVFLTGIRNDTLTADFAKPKRNPRLIIGSHGGPIAHPQWYVDRYKIKLEPYEQIYEGAKHYGRRTKTQTAAAGGEAPSTEAVLVPQA